MAAVFNTFLVVVWMYSAVSSSFCCVFLPSGTVLNTFLVVVWMYSAVCSRLSVVCSYHPVLCSTHSLWWSECTVLCSQHCVLSCVHTHGMLCSCQCVVLSHRFVLRTCKGCKGENPRWIDFYELVGMKQIGWFEWYLLPRRYLRAFPEESWSQQRDGSWEWQMQWRWRRFWRNVKRCDSV